MKDVIEKKSTYRYRRQFVLGPRFIDHLPGWQQHRLFSSFCLTSHPDLTVTHAQQGNKELWLIGYILDPARPERTDADILQHLLQQSGPSVTSIFGQTNTLSGRWILIFRDQGHTFLFHDAAGLRQVCFATDTGGHLWCASQPGLLATELDLRTDAETKAFLDSAGYKGLNEPWWPGDSSPYAEVRQLLPNHYLDMQAQQVHRYWPVGPLASRPPEQAAREGAEILRGSLRSANRRFELALPLTAGWDSRVLLASTKDIAPEVFYYTLQYSHMKPDHEDIVVPQKLLGKFQHQHHVLPCPGSMSPAFEEVYMSNVSHAHPSWGVIAEGLLRHYPEQKVCLKGSVSEIARNFYNNNGQPISDAEVDANRLGALCWMGDNPFALKHFEAWLKEAREVTKDTGIRVMDLFYWEQRVGKWQAVSQLEWDIVQEAFTPYNCRQLLEVLLSADARYRLSPDYKLYEALARELWPETLSEPVNPASVKRKKITGFIKLILRKTHLMPLYQKYKEDKKRRRVEAMK